MSTNFIWLASYPRSGNTYLRTILFKCFGLRSGSVYPNDLGESAELRQAAGHIEPVNRTINFGSQSLQLIKTHRLQEKVEARTIYVVRNGIDAVRSMHAFYSHKIPLDQIIGGWRFGTWAEHLSSWRPDRRPDTLLLRYEDIDRDVGLAVDAISEFIGVEPLARTLPGRAVLADGQWVNVQKDKTPLSPEELALFRAVNGQVMSEYGYEC